MTRKLGAVRYPKLVLLAMSLLQVAIPPQPTPLVPHASYHLCLNELRLQLPEKTRIRWLSASATRISPVSGSIAMPVGLAKRLSSPPYLPKLY